MNQANGQANASAVWVAVDGEQKTSLHQQQQNQQQQFPKSFLSSIRQHAAASSSTPSSSSSSSVSKPSSAVPGATGTGVTIRRLSDVVSACPLQAKQAEFAQLVDSLLCEYRSLKQSSSSSESTNVDEFLTQACSRYLAVLDQFIPASSSVSTTARLHHSIWRLIRALFTPTISQLPPSLRAQLEGIAPSERRRMEQRLRRAMFGQWLRAAVDEELDKGKLILSFVS